MNRFVVHVPAHTPTLASFCPDLALDEFDIAQRNDELFALRMLRLAVCEANGLSLLGVRRAFRLPSAESSY